METGRTSDFTCSLMYSQELFELQNPEVAGEIFNIGSGKPHSINYLDQSIGGGKLFIPKRTDEPKSRMLTLGEPKQSWTIIPTSGFEKGVWKVMDDIEHWNAAPVWRPQSIEKQQELGCKN